MDRPLAILLLFLLAAPSATAQSLTPIGVWQDASSRIWVEIAPCGAQLCGKIVWFKSPNNAQGEPLLDLKNTDPALRRRSLLGLTILTGLRRADENRWVDGKIYNPQDGVNYEALITIQDNGDLRLRTYVLLPLFGKTRIWTRIG
jgi:uncharacterized protein (DUF2147 family)